MVKMVNAILYHNTILQLNVKCSTKNVTQKTEQKLKKNGKFVCVRICLFHFGDMLKFVSFAFNYERGLCMATMTFSQKKKSKLMTLLAKFNRKKRKQKKNI